MGRFAIAAYLNVPVYAAFHEWLGRGDALRPMWDAVEGGRPQGARSAAIPDQVVDELIVHGPPEACRAHVQRYVDNGVTTHGPRHPPAQRPPRGRPSGPARPQPPRRRH